MLATLQELFNPKIRKMKHPSRSLGGTWAEASLRDGYATKYSRYEPSRLQFDSATN